MRFGVIGLYGERGLIAGDGFLVVPEIAPRVTEVVVSLGELRCDLECSLKARRRLIEAAEIEQRHAEIGLGDSEIGLQRDRLDDSFRPLLRVGADAAARCPDCCAI